MMLNLPIMPARGEAPAGPGGLAAPSHGLPIAYLTEHYHSCASTLLDAHRVHFVAVLSIFMQLGPSGAVSVTFLISLMAIWPTTVMSSFA